MGSKKDRDRSRSSFARFVENSSFASIFWTWIVVIVTFAFIYFYFSLMGLTVLQSSVGPISDTVDGFTGALLHSAGAATATGGAGYTGTGALGNLLFLLELIIGLVLYGILIAKLVGFKQDTILEEINDINYEEAFTNYRRGLSLVRADIMVIIEKIESGNLKHREVKDLWIIFSGLDQTLTNIKSLVMPEEAGKKKTRRLEAAKLELILSSMKLTMNKVAELIKALKSHGIDWRDELLLTSVYYDIQIVKEILENELRKTSDRKVIDKIHSVKIVVDELEADLRAPKMQAIHREEPVVEEVVMQPPRHFSEAVEEEPRHEEQHYHEPRVVEDMPEDRFYEDAGKEQQEEETPEEKDPRLDEHHGRHF
jgi:hypothetical protein